MGIPHSTARVIAPISFLYDFAAQQYGLQTNMKAVHDANLSFWSPNPYFIGAFFFPQQIFQLVWMYKLWKGQGTKEEVARMTDYTPLYVLGNFCIGTWMFFWNSADLKTANVFVWVNSLSQLAYIFSGRLGPLNTRSTPSTLTHIIAKTFAGIGVLDLLHNTSVAYFKDAAPSTAVKAVTGLGFAALASGSDWIFGGCLVYDLVALAVGQSGSWRALLGAYAVGAAAIVSARNWLLPPYVSKEVDYQHAAQDEVDENV